MGSRRERNPAALVWGLPAGLSMRRKLVLILTLVSSLAVLVAVVVLGGYQILTFRQRIVDDLLMKAEMVAANCSGALSFDDDRDAAEVLASLKADPAIVSTWVLRADGTVLGSEGALRVDEGPCARSARRVQRNAAIA